MLEQRLQQKLLQRLSPQQIQLIKMLEIPTMELEQRIKKELEENPALEEGSEEDEILAVPDDDNIDFNDDDNEDSLNDDTLDSNDDADVNSSKEDDFSFEDYISEDDQDEIPYYKLQANNNSADDEQREFIFSNQDSFIDNLIAQIGFLDLNSKQRSIAEYIVGNIDEKGYLQRDVEQMVDDLAFTLNIHADAKEVEAVLKQIQTLDPPGVGARNIAECFLIQLQRKPKTKPVLDAIKIIEKAYDELIKKHYDKIQRKLNIDVNDLKLAINEIQTLTINPGNTYANSYDTALNQLIPDFMVEIEEGEIKVFLNSKNSPELRVSKSFKEMLNSLEVQAKKNKKAKNNKEALQFARQKVDSAYWFIEAIKQRQNTLLTTMQAIVHIQKDFFIEGDKSLLKPMILKDVADLTGFDISTISRVVSNKYVSTAHGVFPLKFFFSEAMSTDNDEEISTYKIKERIQQIIADEDKLNPITDEELANLLKKEGLNVARRTVAKYREQLNIPVARLRKEL
ncbi:MAG: RNA polymerase factor sigma-54 [Bacteroidales bacterium]